MPVAGLDPKPALVVIDLQKGLRGAPGGPHSVDEVITRSAELAAAFRARDFPVVLVNATGQPPGRTERRKGATGPAVAPPADFAELVAELGAQPTDLLITKQRWGAFYETPLDGQLRDLGVTQVVVTGIASSIGVESTARSAYEYGYNVVLATDAMTDVDPAAHANSVERIFPRLGETATTREILDVLEA